jgi:hypothetical protein
VMGFACRTPGQHRTFLKGTGSSVPDLKETFRCSTSDLCGFQL